MLKNTAGQQWQVFAFRDATSPNPGAPVEGDEANITAEIKIGAGATLEPTNDVNPTPVPGQPGYYVFDLLQAETNADQLWIYPVSATAGVDVVGVNGSYSPKNPPLNGPYALTVNVVDDGTGLAIPSPFIRAAQGLDSETQQPVSGSHAFALGAGTWELTVNASGYAGAVASADIPSENTKEIRLSRISGATSAEICNVLFRVVDHFNEPQPLAKVSVEIIGDTPFAADSIVVDRTRTARTGTTGEASFVLIQGQQYSVTIKKHGTKKEFEYTVPAAAEAIATQAI